MSIGIIIVIALSLLAGLVAIGVLNVAVVRSSQTASRHALGQASDIEQAQADHTAILVAVGTAILFAFLLFGMPLAKTLGDGMVADPEEETPTSTAVDAH